MYSFSNERFGTTYSTRCRIAAGNRRRGRAESSQEEECPEAGHRGRERSVHPRRGQSLEQTLGSTRLPRGAAPSFRAGEGPGKGRSSLTWFMRPGRPGESETVADILAGRWAGEKEKSFDDL